MLRLTLPQLEATYKDLPGIRIIESEQNNLNLRLYKITNNNQITSIISQPVTVGDYITENKELEDLIPIIKAKNLNGVSQIIIPLGQTCLINIPPFIWNFTNNHFITLKLDINPKTGQIISGQTIDSKGAFISFYHQEIKIKKILENNFKQIKLNNRIYLNKQGIANNIDCGPYTTLIIKELIKDPDANLHEQIILSAEIASSIRNKVKDIKLQNTISYDSLDESIFLSFDIDENTSSSCLSSNYKYKYKYKYKYEYYSFGSKKQLLISTGKNILNKIYALDQNEQYLYDFGNSNVPGSIFNNDNSAEKLSIDFDKLYRELKESSIPNLISFFKMINRTFNGDYEYANKRRNYLLAITCVMWALDSEYNVNNKDAEQIYKFSDKDHRLYKFLLGYVKFSNRKENVGYYRSNDFSSTTDYDGGYSISMRLFGGKDLIKMLPNQHRAIEFKSLDDNINPSIVITSKPDGYGNYEEQAKLFLYNFGRKNTNSKEFQNTKSPISIAVDEIENRISKVRSLDFATQQIIESLKIIMLNLIKSQKQYSSNIDDYKNFSLSDFIAKAYPYPEQPNSRDQLVIDTITKYVAENELSSSTDPRVMQMINFFAAINGLQQMKDRIDTINQNPDNEILNSLCTTYLCYYQKMDSAYNNLCSISNKPKM